MILSRHQANYLPYPGLFSKIFHSDCFIYVNNVKFEHYSWQSRNRIIGESNYIVLTVPTLKNKSLRIIKDVEIDNKTNWKEFKKAIKGLKTTISILQSFFFLYLDNNVNDHVDELKEMTKEGLGENKRLYT